MEKILYIFLIISSSLFGSIERTFHNAANMHLDYYKGLDVRKSINKSIKFYDTKLSLIDRNNRQDQLIYLAAEINGEELFLVEMRFNGSNISLLKKSYRVKSSIIKIEKDFELYSAQQLHLTDKDIGLWSVRVGSVRIASFNDSEEARRLVYELEVSLNQNFYAKKYVYSKPKQKIMESNFLHMNKNTLTQYHDGTPENKICTYFEVIREELHLRVSPESKAKKLNLLHKGDTVQLVKRGEHSWYQVMISNTKRIGWIYVGKPQNPTVKEFTNNCI